MGKNDTKANQNARGSGGSNNQGSEKSSGGIPKGKLVFMTGENQREHFIRLIDCLATKALGESPVGGKMAHVLQTQKEHEFEAPRLAVPPVKENPTEEDTKEYERQKTECEIKFKMESEDRRTMALCI